MNYSEIDIDLGSWELSCLINRALKEGNKGGLVSQIRKFWDNESWKSIKEKYSTEGSIWIVWWYDGLRNYLKEIQ